MEKRRVRVVKELPPQLCGFTENNEPLQGADGRIAFLDQLPISSACERTSRIWQVLPDPEPTADLFPITDSDGVTLDVDEKARFAAPEGLTHGNIK